MSEEPSTEDATADELKLAGYASVLADKVEEALPNWVAASVASRLPGPPDGDIAEQLEQAGQRAITEVGTQVRQLLDLDIDDQWTNPLTLIRSAVRFPTEILESVGVAESPRDAQAKRFHPADIYDLTPSSFADLGPDVHEAGMVWGAAKAHVHLRRRRDEQMT